MWWEMRRVSYDLQAGVITRKPTINVKQVPRLSEKCSAFHQTPAAAESVATRPVSPPSETGKRGLVGLSSATSQLKPPGTGRSVL